MKMRSSEMRGTSWHRGSGWGPEGVPCLLGLGVVVLVVPLECQTLWAHKGIALLACARAPKLQQLLRGWQT